MVRMESGVSKCATSDLIRAIASVIVSAILGLLGERCGEQHQSDGRPRFSETPNSLRSNQIRGNSVTPEIFKFVTQFLSLREFGAILLDLYPPLVFLVSDELFFNQKVVDNANP